MKYELTTAFNAPSLKVHLRSKDKVSTSITLQAGEGTIPADQFKQLLKVKVIEAYIRDGLLRFPDHTDSEAIFGLDAEKRRRELYDRLGEPYPDDTPDEAMTETVQRVVQDNQDLQSTVEELSALVREQAEQMKRMEAATAKDLANANS